MKLTRVVPVFGHNVQEESALYVLGKRQRRAVYLGPYGLPCCQEEFDFLLAA